MLGMKNYKIRYALIFTILLLACTAFLMYVDDHANNYKILSEKSQNGKYSVEVFQTGYAEKPNGSVPFAIKMYDEEKNREIIADYEGIFYIDGRLLSKEMMKTKWTGDSFQLIMDDTAGEGTITVQMTIDGDVSVIYRGF